MKTTLDTSEKKLFAHKDIFIHLFKYVYAKKKILFNNNNNNIIIIIYIIYIYIYYFLFYVLFIH